MATSADDLLKQALALNEPERARLVAELPGTLEPESARKWLSKAEWIAEIERRARAALTGRAAISWPFPAMRQGNASKTASVVNERRPTRAGGPGKRATEVSARGSSG